MKPTFKSILALAIGAAAMVFASCSNADGNNPVVPSQQEIESKIIGKWKRLNVDGKDVVTNNREVFTFKADGTGSHSMSIFQVVEKRWVWNNKLEMVYSVTNNKICIKQDVTLNISVDEIKESHLLWTVESIIADGTDIKDINKVVSKKISSDYSQDIIGMWEGVEMTGPETYGNAEARIEYNADGTYTYYKKEGDYWVPSADVDNEWNVDGDWLATRWRPEAGADYNYEWWDIDEIKDGTMKWSALREKEDGTRFTTTFTWKKVEVPTQKEIETKIIGKWKTVGINGEDCLTNNRSVFTYNTDGSKFSSLSTFSEPLSQYIWENHFYGTYSIAGNIMTQFHQDNDITTFSDIYAITDNHFVEHNFKLNNGSQEVETNTTYIQKKVTADYTNDIIGMWEGVEMTGYETYGNAEARIEYKADGTYTYYKKENDEWVPSANVDNEYNVDGDWLAHRWRPESGADYNYEWWDIDEIKDGTMKWSALREKEDGTRFTTTFTWKKVEMPTQKEIETKIIGKWKTVGMNGVDCLTNNRAVFTYNTDGSFFSSLSTYIEHLSQYKWDNHVYGTYSIAGNIMTQLHPDMGNTTFSDIYAITDNHFVEHNFKVNDGSQEVETNITFIQKKITADYTNDILGMWEGVEMIGYETYGNAEARIEYKADGTYTYYKKENDEWVPSANVGNEYNVDGDWLAHRWRPEAGADYNYEWWDIDYIKGDEMKWSALREKEDGTRFNTTFTWKKVVK